MIIPQFRKESQKMGQVNFRKGFWNCYYFGTSSLLVSKVANVQPRSLSSSAILDVSVTCQGCLENSPRKIRAQFQASSGYSDSANWPEYEAGEW